MLVASSRLFAHCDVVDMDCNAGNSNGGNGSNSNGANGVSGVSNIFTRQHSISGGNGYALLLANGTASGSSIVPPNTLTTTSLRCDKVNGNATSILASNSIGGGSSNNISSLGTGGLATFQPTLIGPPPSAALKTSSLTSSAILFGGSSGNLSSIAGKTAGTHKWIGSLCDGATSIGYSSGSSGSSSKLNQQLHFQHPQQQQQQQQQQQLHLLQHQNKHHHPHLSQQQQQQVHSQHHHHHSLPVTTSGNSGSNMLDSLTFRLCDVDGAVSSTMSNPNGAGGNGATNGTAANGSTGGGSILMVHHHHHHHHDSSASVSLLPTSSSSAAVQQAQQQALHKQQLHHLRSAVGGSSGNVAKGNDASAAASYCKVTRIGNITLLDPEDQTMLQSHMLGNSSNSSTTGAEAYEHHEIYNYPRIYFIGANAKKRRGAGNSDYDNEQGSYIHIAHDHIAYRYEVLKIIGKGSFGQVVKAYDHRNFQHVALKMIRNEQRFHRQAQEEIRILKHLRAQDRYNSMNIIHMYDSFVFRNHMCITFELLYINLFREDGREEIQGSYSKRGRYRGAPGTRDLAKVLNYCDDLFLDFVKHCLRWDPKRRMTPQEALNHNWFHRMLPQSPQVVKVVSDGGSESAASTTVSTGTTAGGSSSHSTATSISKQLTSSMVSGVGGGVGGMESNPGGSLAAAGAAGIGSISMGS
uniref:dual-specificity kinase n=1 Tax=Anopheles minimus TaxID=112268 RepID=A0A182W6T1_9DIPT